MYQIITASPYLPPQHNFNAAAPTRQYESFATRAGCANSTDTLSCLRSKDSLTLQTANSDVNAANFHGHWAFSLVTEPESGFIYTHPSDSLIAGLVNGEHMLATTRTKVPSSSPQLEVPMHFKHGCKMLSLQLLQQDSKPSSPPIRYPI
jgi:hypothetical protein